MTKQECIAGVLARECERREWSPWPRRQVVERERLRDLCQEHGVSWSEGAHSFSVPRWKLRVCSPQVRGPANEPMTEYELAAYFARTMNERIGCKHKGAPHTKQHWAALGSTGAWHYYYARPTGDAVSRSPDGSAAFDGVYVDLRAAYWNIYTALGTWDIRYIRGQSLGIGHVPLPRETSAWLWPMRGARNGLIGLAGARWRRVYMPDGRVVSVPAYGVTNYMLALVVLDTLQAVMHDTRKVFGSVHYINTDGAIVYEDDAPRVLDYWRETWGLDGTVKAHGRTSIEGVGAYRVGDTVSGHYGTRGAVARDTVLSCCSAMDDVWSYARLRIRPHLLRTYPDRAKLMAAPGSRGAHDQECNDGPHREPPTAR